MSPSADAGFLPPHIATFLRIEGLTVFATALAAFHLTGGSWWLFAALILAPDLSAIGYAAGPRAGATTYNLVHTYTVPIGLGGLTWLAGGTWALPVALIWIAHIGIDRALGYGLKLDSFGVTHLGLIGRAKREALKRADAR